MWYLNSLTSIYVRISNHINICINQSSSDSWKGLTSLSFLLSNTPWMHRNPLRRGVKASDQVTEDLVEMTLKEKRSCSKTLTIFPQPRVFVCVCVWEGGGTVLLVRVCLALHDSSSFHGYGDILQVKLEGVGECNSSEHVLVDLRDTVHLDQSWRKELLSKDQGIERGRHCPKEKISKTIKKRNSTYK